ncbi:hypothetical protein [Henriciella sp.]|uniref:ImuA family protein n=1 Tax=Henriciella sp. TaxID=1968823 RepID=UPI0026334F63|nr:hypothetical protein [Henriciella sp.]
MASPPSLSPAVFRLGTAPAKGRAAFPLGLGDQGIHEVCEAGFGDYGALTGFVLGAAPRRTGAVVWVSQTHLVLNHGRLLETGLKALRRERLPTLHVQVRKPMEALWAVEEAIRSKAAGLVVAEVLDMDFTASRRLTLASGRHGVPAILLMPYSREGATAAAARWRVSPRPSAPNRYDSKAPGHPRWHAVLERSRQAPHMAGHSFDLELDDETLSLRVVSGLATDPAEAETVRPEHTPDTRRRA